MRLKKTEKKDKVYKGKMGSYRVLKEIPYMNEEGVKQGTLEIGSIQLFPAKLAKPMVKSGDLEEVKNEEKPENVNPSQPVDVYTAKAYKGERIIGLIEDVVVRGKKYLKFKAGRSQAEYWITLGDFTSNASYE